MKLLLVVIFTSAFPNSAICQKMIKEGKIEYSAIRYYNANTPKERANTSRHTIYYNHKVLKHIFTPKKNVNYNLITQCGESTTMCYATNGIKHYIIEDNPEKYVLNLGLYANEEPEIQYVNDTATINGFFCKKALLNFSFDGEAEVMEVWYSDLYSIKTDCFNFFFKNFKGFPIRIRTKEKSSLVFDKNAVTNVEYLVTAIEETHGYDPGTVASLDKYETVAPEDKGNKLMEILMGNSAAVIEKPKGVPVTNQISSDNGATISLTRYNPFKIGEKLQDFNMLNLDGERRTMDSYTGQTLVLNFWFTKCAPCINEMPFLNNVAAGFKNNKVSFISITYNSKKEVTTFLKNQKFDFEHLVNAKEVIEKYGVSSYPTTVIVDSNGYIRYVKADGFSNEDELRTEINNVLNQ